MHISESGVNEHSHYTYGTRKNKLFPESVESLAMDNCAFRMQNGFTQSFIRSAPYSVACYILPDYNEKQKIYFYAEPV